MLPGRQTNTKHSAVPVNTGGVATQVVEPSPSVSEQIEPTLQVPGQSLAAVLPLTVHHLGPAHVSLPMQTQPSVPMSASSRRTSASSSLSPSHTNSLAVLTASIQRSEPLKPARNCVGVEAAVPKLTDEVSAKVTTVFEPYTVLRVKLRVQSLDKPPPPPST